MNGTLHTAIIFLLILNFSSFMGFGVSACYGRRHRHMIHDDRSQFRCPPFKDNFRGKLRIVVVPGGDVCINGKKLEKEILSDNPWTQLKILKRIAILFSSCNDAAAGMATKRCVKIQRYILSILRRMNTAPALKLMAKFFIRNLK